MTMNREEWLTRMAQHIQKLFCYPLQPYKISCGWPYYRPHSKLYQRLGECHTPNPLSPDAPHEIFISPIISDPLNLGHTIAHELAHVMAGVQDGHGSLFQIACGHADLICDKSGYTKPGQTLIKHIQIGTEELGPYPHIPLKVPGRNKSTIILHCARCSIHIAIHKKTLINHGPPICPCGRGFIPILPKDPSDVPCTW